MSCSAVLFDLDGTIWNSTGLYRAAGCGSGAGATSDALRAAGHSETSWSEFVEEHAGRSYLHEGLGECLRALVAESIPLGIITNLPRWVAYPLLDHHQLWHYFGSIVCNGPDSPPKPSPEQVRSAVFELSVPVGPDVLVVGDTCDDLLAARRSGASFAWASWDSQPSVEHARLLAGAPRLASLQDVCKFVFDPET